jgi:alcohol dehydrogenase
MLPVYYEFHNPVKIISGRKALESLPFELGQMGAAKPLIVTDPGVVSAGLVKHVLNAFLGSGLTIGGVFDQVPPDSAKKTVSETAQAYRQAGCDALIAVGGGSAIDTGKAANILVSENADDLTPFVGSDLLKRPLKPFVVIPTTSGTGSEVTCAAVIADPDKNVKLALTSRYLLPRLAILDPRMTLTLPPRITAATAMDTLAHAMESCTSIQKNPLSDAYAWAAIRLLKLHLLDVIRNGRDEMGRLALANASCMAGLAFSNSMVGVVHALGHACGGLCPIPHGVAMNIFLPHGLRYNLKRAGEMIGELLLPLAGEEIYVRTPLEARGEKTVETVIKLRDDLHELTGLPRTLREAGVPREKLPDMALKALADGSVLFNPEEVEYEDALALLNRAYE